MKYTMRPDGVAGLRAILDGIDSGAEHRKMSEALWDVRLTGIPAEVEILDQIGACPGWKEEARLLKRVMPKLPRPWKKGIRGNHRSDVADTEAYAIVDTLEALRAGNPSGAVRLGWRGYGPSSAEDVPQYVYKFYAQIPWGVGRRAWVKYDSGYFSYEAPEVGPDDIRASAAHLTRYKVWPALGFLTLFGFSVVDSAAPQVDARLPYLCRMVGRSDLADLLLTVGGAA
jgi:hypothetical protein